MILKKGFAPLNTLLSELEKNKKKWLLAGKLGGSEHGLSPPPPLWIGVWPF